MDKVLYVASNGAKRMLHNQTVKSNNLSNIRTTGFRKDFTQAESYNLIGEVYPSRAYGLVKPNASDMKQGYIEQTGRDLDVAINGQGWFVIQNEAGEEAMTRAGEFLVNDTGQLLTPSGHPVIGNGGPIAIPPYQRIFVGGDGTISIQPLGADANTVAVVNQLKLVNPGDDQVVKKLDGRFYLREAGELVADTAVRAKSGYLERSNVNGVDEMVDMISIARQYEMQMKMMQTADEKAGRTAQLLSAN